MTERDIERRLQTAVSHAVPNVLESVLAACEEQKGKVTVMTQNTNINTTKKQNVTPIRRILGTAAALLILAGAIAGYFTYQQSFAVDSTVSLDVNPSVIIQINKQEKVLDVLPLNDDGRTIVKDLDFKGSDLDVTVNALVGSMLRNGFLDDLANSILVSVDNDNEKAAADLQKRLSAEIDSILTTDAFSGSVLSQVVEKDDELESLAEKYGISVGKAQLIRRITTQNTAYNFEDLVGLTINELNLLSESGKLHLENVAATGNASDKSYVGEEKAKTAALKHAGLKESDLNFYRCEMDYENGRLVYELDFVANGYDYDYEINAKTGDVVKYDKEWDDDAPLGTTQQTESTTTQAKPTQQKPTQQKPTQQKTESTKKTTAAQSYVGESKAKSAALKHAGVKESELVYFTCKLDRDDGRVLYDIEFAANGFEYDYEINAKTGKVVSYEREHDDDTVKKPTGTTTTKKTRPKTTAAASELISQSKAKSIALKHAGVSADEVRGYEFERDYDNGRTVYEIGFRVGRYEYEYEINAKTGEVLHSEKDYDD